MHSNWRQLCWLWTGQWWWLEMHARYCSILFRLDLMIDVGSDLLHLVPYWQLVEILHLCKWWFHQLQLALVLLFQQPLDKYIRTPLIHVVLSPYLMFFLPLPTGETALALHCARGGGNIVSWNHYYASWKNGGPTFGTVLSFAGWPPSATSPRAGTSLSEPLETVSFVYMD